MDMGQVLLLLAECSDILKYSRPSMELFLPSPSNIHWTFITGLQQIN